MYLDTAENAPAFLPDDITEKLGLPADLQADRIFIHKTANYENYIVVQEGRVVAYTPSIKDSKPYAIFTLDADETISNISSIGNTVILATSKFTHYVLFRSQKYTLLGNQIPFPTVEFFDARTPLKKGAFSEGGESIEEGVLDYYELSIRQSLIDNENGANVVTYLSYPYIDDVGGKASSFDEEAWAALEDDYYNSNTAVKELVDSIRSTKDLMISANEKKGYFSYPIWALYAVRLYDDSLIISTPQLLSPGQESPVDVKGFGVLGSPMFLVRLNHYYKLGIRLHDFPESEYQSWVDIIKGIDVFISEDINRLDFRNLTIAEKTTISPANMGGTIPVAKFKIDGEDKSFIRHALSCANFVRVEEFYIDESFYGDTAKPISDIRKDYICDATDYLKMEDRYKGKKLLSDTTYKTNEYNLLADSMHTYNNSVFYSGVRKQYTSNPKCLPAKRNNCEIPLLIPSPFEASYTVNLLPSWFWEKDRFPVNTNQKYELSFSWDDVTVRGKSKDGYVYNAERRYDDLDTYVHSLLLYPHSACTEAQYLFYYDENVKRKSTVKMNPHPAMPEMSYFYDNKSLDSQSYVTSNDLPQEMNEEKSNDLIVSKIDNPLLYETTYTFQSKVLGIAVASTALSQGQFGQFPLYVFTEDGIWAMETAADGSFVTSKPLSREVCANPASITSIDNAVVFVTEKAVMLIQGSEVVNISPFMNGRHYTPNESALSLIRKQEGFGEFENVIKDETPFMSFMKKASIAYDYAGQRLICIAEGEDYQYIFKLDTQTWHKVAFSGFDLHAPINSYPECLIKGTGKEFLISDSLLAATCRVLGLDKNYDAEDCEAIIRNKRAHRIFWEDDFVPTIEEDLELLGYKLSGAGKTVQKYSLLLTDITYIPGALTDDHKRELVDLLGLKSMNDLDNLVNGNVRELALVLYPSKYETALARLRLFFNFTISSETIYYYKDIRIVDNIYAQRSTRVLSLSTLLDVNPESEDAPETAKGILITRPFDLGMPDVFKSITNIRIRGDYDKGNVKYLLQGSDDGRIFYTLSSLRGKSWKMFRIFILADLEPTERISWIDIDFEPRYNNRLR